MQQVESIRSIPVLDHKTSLIGTAELQRMNGSALDQLKERGPQIVCVNNVRKAVLIDYDQYSFFQDRFMELVRIASTVRPMFAHFSVPKGYMFNIEELKLQISGTLEKIQEESPAESSFAGFLDSLMAASNLAFAQNLDAPTELTEKVADRLRQSSRRVERKSSGIKRDLGE